MLAESPVNKKFFFLLIFILLVPSGFVFAEQPINFLPINFMHNETVQNISGDKLLFGLSYFNAMRKNQNALEGRIEYRSSLDILNVNPFAGFSFTSSGAIYGMAGFYYDIPLSNSFIFTPSFAAGYFNKGMGIDLAYELEFRTQIEFSYILNNNSRLGICFYHISNGNFGESNPGAESFSLIYSVPIEN